MRVSVQACSLGGRLEVIEIFWEWSTMYRVSRVYMCNVH